MALYIRDDAVDALAAHLQELTKAPTKTEAVRKALENEIERKRNETPLLERLRQIREDAWEKGLRPNPNFDQKAFFDELSGEE